MKDLSQDSLCQVEVRNITARESFSLRSCPLKLSLSGLHLAELGIQTEYTEPGSACTMMRLQDTQHDKCAFKC